MDYLTVITSDGDSFRHDIDNPLVRIGRSSENDLVLQDPGVSRTQARVERRPEGHFILDVGSKHGTFVNDRRLTGPAKLIRSDRIRVGSTVIVFGDTYATPVEFSDHPLPEGLVTTVEPAQEAGEQPRHPGRSVREIILKADRELLFHRPFASVLEKTMDLAHEAVGYERGLLAIFKDGEIETKVTRVPHGESKEALVVSRAMTEHVRRNRTSILVTDALGDPRLLGRDNVRIQGVRSAMCVPLLSGAEVTGFIYLDSRQVTSLFTEVDLQVLTFLGNFVAAKIENARLFSAALEFREWELDIREAVRIQRTLLPVAGPAIPGYQVAASTLPCREVGGDYYDYIDLGGGRFGIGLGDVAGKGLPAALLMCNFQASLRALSGFGLSLGETMGRLNGLLCRCLPDNRFVTFFYGILDTEGHSLDCVNAAQPPPRIVRQNGSLERLAVGGLPLGMTPGLALSTETVMLRPGDALVCFSDGVTEAMNSANEDFGEDRLERVLEGAGDCPPHQLMEQIIAAVDRHRGDLPHEDDLTILILKRGLDSSQGGGP